jgi:NAD/NADP transhydrogenase alpha subunit
VARIHRRKLAGKISDLRRVALDSATLDFLLTQYRQQAQQLRSLGSTANQNLRNALIGSLNAQGTYLTNLMLAAPEIADKVKIVFAEVSALFR